MYFVARHITSQLIVLSLFLAGISCGRPEQQTEQRTEQQTEQRTEQQTEQRTERRIPPEQQEALELPPTTPGSISLPNGSSYEPVDSKPYNLSLRSEGVPLPVLERAIDINSMDAAARQHIRQRLYTANQRLQQGFFQKALASYDTIRAIIKYNPGYRPYLAQLYSGIANVHGAMGNYDTAVAYFSKGLSLLDSPTIDSFSAVIVYTNFGFFLSSFGYYEKALYYLREAAGLTGYSNKAVGPIYLHIGITYGRMEEKDSLSKAEHYIRKALSLAQQYRDTTTAHAALSNLGLIHKRKLDQDSALYYYQQAMALSTNRPSGKLIVLLNLASLYFSQSDYDKAAGYLEQGIQLKNGSLKERDHLYYWLGLTYQKLGKHQASSMYFHKALQTTDSIKAHKVDAEVQRIQNRYELANAEKERLENRLLIARQEAIIQRKTGLAYAIVGAVVICSAFAWILFRSRRRIQQQQELRRLEMSAWEASIEGEERERRRLAHHLHDHVAGNLTTVRAWLETIGRSKEANYQDAVKLLDETLTEVRNTAHHLMPALLLRMGLVEAVRVFCSNVQRATGLFIRYHYFGFIDIRNKNKELILYRCIQELVQNIVKHAKASQALVQLSRHDTLLIINVEDNGVGRPFSGEENGGETTSKQSTAGSHEGIGLSGIQENIAKIQGRFQWLSEPGKGVSVEIEIPIFDEPE